MATDEIDLGPDPADAPPLRWGILGPGGIARRFAADVPAHTAASIVAVGSRSQERAAAFAADFEIPTAYGCYGDLVADAQVEAVYVASQQSEHLEQDVLARRAGKPVLVEKSVALKTAEAGRLFDEVA